MWSVSHAWVCHVACKSLRMMQVNGMLLEGKKVFVGPFLKRTDRPADKEAHYTNIYVKNLAESVTEEQLDKMFGEYGKVCCSANLLGSAICTLFAVPCWCPRVVLLPLLAALAPV